ncbi:MAG: MFS transporter [Fimbriimonadaceae bacterium]|nr:MFS transporter [Alphaproteobacteria bacterium]
MNQASNIQTDDQQARWNAIMLSIGQAIGGSTAVVVFSSAGLIGQEIASDRSLATAPVTAFILGIAFATIPASMLMRRIGRSGGYFVGSMIGIVGILIAAFAIYAKLFPLFIFGTGMTGIFWAFLQSYRFAATDIASPSFKDRAISWVMVGGVASAVIGPQTVIWTQDLFVAHYYLGSYLAAAVLIAIQCLFVTRVRIPKPVFNESDEKGRPLLEVSRNPVFVVAVLCGAISYATMAFMMTASPLAMVGCGYSHQLSALGIQWHVLAMYVPSFFTGRLLTRFGKVPIITLGMICLIAAALIGTSGITIYHFWVALIFLGVGWNFGFIGATAMVTDCYRPAERNFVQGFNDFVVFGVNALASLSAGFIYFIYGWSAITIVMLPLIAVGVFALVWLTWAQRASVSA